MLEVRGVSKRYGSHRALFGASFTCAPGRIHALLGENGAGKSTLVKILSGVLPPDAGEIRLGGALLTLRSARDARERGIGTAFQELSLVQRMTVAQNLLLNEEPGSGPLISRRRMNAAATAMLERWRAPDIDPEAEIDGLPLAVRQRLEIVRAADHAFHLCILDESTSALPAVDVEWFTWLVRTLRERAVAVAFITHRLSEVRAFCDDLTVLRRGESVASRSVAEVDDDQVVALMLGEPLAAAYPPRSAVPDRTGTPRLSVAAAVRAPTLQAVSFDVHIGEVVGIAALQGQGQEALFRGLFGSPPLDRGGVSVDGEAVRLRMPRDAIRAGLGISFVPEDRKTEGLFLGQTTAENLTIASLDRISRFGWLSARRERALVEGVMRRLSITPGAERETVSSLSGGNQQKVVLGKWLIRGARVMLLYDATRGVDVGTKREIYQIMHAHAASGGAVLWYSTELLELVNVCHRIVVLYRGLVAAEFDGAEARSEPVLRAMLGEPERSA